MPDIEPDTIEIYVVWLYWHVLKPPRVYYKTDDVRGQVSDQEGYMQRYALAEYLADDSMCKRTLDHLISDWGKGDVTIVSPQAAGAWYVQTAAGSPLRTYLVEVVLQFYRKTLHNYDGEIPRDFKTDLLHTRMGVARYALGGEEFRGRLREKVLGR